jgi:hypothetical protein
MRKTIRVCAFGNTELKRAKERFQHQFKKIDRECSIKIYDEYTMPAEYVHKYGHIFTKEHRGYGYWTWKPAIINDVINSSLDGDIIIYSDLGNYVNPHGKLMYQHILRTLDGLRLPIIANQLSSDQFIERRYTKGDVLDYFRVRDQQHIINTGMYQAGIIFFIKTPETTSIFRSWLSVLHDGLHLFDDSPSISPSYVDFVDHRHDQSAFSIISKINQIYSIPAEFFFVSDYRQINYLKFSPILHLRDMGGDLPYNTESYLRYLSMKVTSKINYLRNRHNTSI